MEKYNPNFHERLRQETPKSWSDLPSELVNLVFERLSFANIRRAESVCSSWYSVSKQLLPKNHNHWLILFPEDNNNDNSSCTLFNPEEKDKLYKTQDFGAEFAKSVCIATYGTWFLMHNPLDHNIYIVNLFTHERINLPPVELLWKDYWSRNSEDKRIMYTLVYLRSPVFWIDEKTKDYVVVWGLRDWRVFYSKKGDTSWNQIPQTSDCHDYFSRAVYKNHKLYYLSFDFSGELFQQSCHFKIFDFSGEIPQQTFQCDMRLSRDQNYGLSFDDPLCVKETKIVVTVTGDVLKVERMLRHKSRTQLFRVYKVYSSAGLCKNEEEKVDSLGDESMLFDQGTTVLANDTDGGLIRNSIYFSNYHFNDIYGKRPKYLYIFNLETQKTETLHTFHLYTSSSQVSRAQWFLPTFTPT